MSTVILNLIFKVPQPRSYASEGIVIARRNYSESDRIIVVFTKDYGRVSLLAKSVRLPKSRKRGHVEVFSYIKFLASSGSGLDYLTEVETVDTFGTSRKDLSRVSLLYYFSEVIGKVTREHEKNEQLFDLILSYFEGIKDESKLKSMKKSFIKDVLTCLGYWPEGRSLPNPEDLLSEVSEREMLSERVGRRVLSL